MSSAYGLIASSMLAMGIMNDIRGVHIPESSEYKFKDDKFRDYQYKNRLVVAISKELKRRYIRIKRKNKEMSDEDILSIIFKKNPELLKKIYNSTDDFKTMSYDIIVEIYKTILNKT